jgi:hypothetical protein
MHNENIYKWRKKTVKIYQALHMMCGVRCSRCRWQNTRTRDGSSHHRKLDQPIDNVCSLHRVFSPSWHQVHSSNIDCRNCPPNDISSYDQYHRFLTLNKRVKQANECCWIFFHRWKLLDIFSSER